MSKKKILNMNSKYDSRFELRIFKNLPNEILADKEFIKAAVSYNGRLLEYVPDKFKEDKEIVGKSSQIDPLIPIDEIEY